MKETAMSFEELERRIAALERDVALLKSQLARRTEKESWVDRILGSFKDDKEFEEIIRLGREFRKSYR